MGFGAGSARCCKPWLASAVHVGFVMYSCAQASRMGVRGSLRDRFCTASRARKSGTGDAAHATGLHGSPRCAAAVIECLAPCDARPAAQCHRDGRSAFWCVSNHSARLAAPRYMRAALFHCCGSAENVYLSPGLTWAWGRNCRPGPDRPSSSHTQNDGTSRPRLTCSADTRPMHRMLLVLSNMAPHMLGVLSAANSTLASCSGACRKKRTCV